eukprot:6039344-Pyramimonas_sp.AAC.1
MAYAIGSGLVGSEMCIRDRQKARATFFKKLDLCFPCSRGPMLASAILLQLSACSLLFWSMHVSFAICSQASLISFWSSGKDLIC